MANVPAAMYQVSKYELSSPQLLNRRGVANLYRLMARVCTVLWSPVRNGAVCLGKLGVGCLGCFHLKVKVFDLPRGFRSSNCVKDDDWPSQVLLATAYLGRGYSTRRRADGEICSFSVRAAASTDLFDAVPSSCVESVRGVGRLKFRPGRIHGVGSIAKATRDWHPPDSPSSSIAGRRHRRGCWSSSHIGACCRAKACCFRPRNTPASVSNLRDKIGTERGIVSAFDASTWPPARIGPIGGFMPANTGDPVINAPDRCRQAQDRCRRRMEAGQNERAAQPTQHLTRSGTKTLQ